MSEPAILKSLMSVIQQRRDQPPTGRRSYVASLLEGGIPAIGAKITEEAGEIVDAAGEPGEAGRDHVIHEAADLLFHTMVLLAHRQVEWEAIEVELARRFGIGGFEEKASRHTTD